MVVYERSAMDAGTQILLSFFIVNEYKKTCRKEHKSRHWGRIIHLKEQVHVSVG